MKKSIFIFIACLLFAARTFATPINVVAAENFYGELANEIGGKYVSVHSIIDSPNADPHLFATSPKTSIAISKAQVIIYSGANYDDWMQQILKSQTDKSLIIINVGDLMKIKVGANPHIWYKAATMPTLATDLANKLIAINPKAREDINANLKKFLENQDKVSQKITQMKKQYNGIPVTATEPVFGYMADEIGLNMQGLDFQWKIMNDTEPSPKMLADYQSLFINKKVKILFYNDQVTDETTKNILKLAKKNNIQIVGVTETMPKLTKISDWFLDELNETDKALKATTAK